MFSVSSYDELFHGSLDLSGSTCYDSRGKIV
jgi:hypothetical protein